MAEDSLVQLLQNQQAPEQEIVETWPGFSPEGKDGLSSLLGRKAGDVIQRIRETFDPGIPEEAFPATTRRELERKEVPAGEPIEVIPSIMDIIYQKETGIYPDPFIRTMVEGKGTDAFGPGQIRRDLLKDLLGSELTTDERKLTNKLIEQSIKFQKFNERKIKDPRFGPGGKGEGLDDDEKRIYRNLAEKGLLIKAAHGKYDINNLSEEDIRNLIGDWYSKSNDPKRRKERQEYIESAIDMAPLKALIGIGIIKPPPKKPTRNTGGMVSRNPYPHNPRPI